jgi:hypothetical protein
MLRRDVDAAGVLACVVDRSDVRVTQGRSMLGFSHEACARGFIRKCALGRKLEREETTEFQISRLVDDTHSCGAERRDNLIPADLRASKSFYELLLFGNTPAR